MILFNILLHTIAILNYSLDFREYVDAAPFRQFAATD